MERLLQNTRIRRKRPPPPDLGMGNTNGRGAEAEGHAEHHQPPQRLPLAGRKPLLSVAPHVAVPDVGESVERQMLEARAAVVFGACGWNHPDALLLRGETAAEVDILEPGRRELFVEGASLFERFTAQQQRRRGPLLDGSRRSQIDAAVTG